MVATRESETLVINFIVFILHWKRPRNELCVQYTYSLAYLRNEGLAKLKAQLFDGWKLLCKSRKITMAVGSRVKIYLIFKNGKFLQADIENESKRHTMKCSRTINLKFAR